MTGQSYEGQDLSADCWADLIRSHQDKDVIWSWQSPRHRLFSWLEILPQSIATQIPPNAEWEPILYAD